MLILNGNIVLDVLQNQFQIILIFSHLGTSDQAGLYLENGNLVGSLYNHDLTLDVLESIENYASGPI